MANEFKIRNGLIIETVPGSSTENEILVINGSSGLVESRTTLTTSSISNFDSNVSASAAANGFGNFSLDGTGVYSSSAQIDYTGLQNIPSGIVSGSSQIDYDSISNVPANIVSSSTQIDELGFYSSGSDAEFGNLHISNEMTASGLASNGSERTPLVIDENGNIYVGADYSADTGSGSVDMTAPDTANAIIVSVASGSKELKQIDATADFKNQNIQNLGTIIGSDIVSGSAQVSFNGITDVPANLISGSGQRDILGLSETDDVTFNTLTAETITAETFIVSSSVTYMTTSYQSGSTAWGDSIDDTHIMTGSLKVSGSFELEGDSTINGSLTVSGSGIALFDVGTDGILKHTTAGVTNITSDTTIVSLSNTSYTSLQLEYYLRNNTQDAYRAGRVIYVWNSNNSTYEVAEISTNDLGNSTAGIDFSGSMAGGNFEAILNRTSGTWVVRIKGNAL